MTEKSKATKPPKRWTGKPGFEHWGEVTKEPVYKDGLGKRVGGWLTGLLTAWKR